MNELLLSRFEGSVPPEALGPIFETDETIAELFPSACTRTTIREPSGLWHFERHRG
jgi:hypothetical protein